MSWCSKWIHGNEWPEGVLVTLGRDGNVQRYVPDCERDKLQAENDKLREKLKEETAENKWAREFLNGIAERIRQANAHSLVNYVETIEDQNAKLRELVRDLYCLAYPTSVEWEASDAAYDKYSPCEKCHELCGGKSPCARTAKDMAEEYCKPIQAVVVADRMKELGVDS